MNAQKTLRISSEKAAKSLRESAGVDERVDSVQEPLVSSAALAAVLDRLPNPGALADSPFLRSWEVRELLRAEPAAKGLAAEFVIGRALERQLDVWSYEFRLHASYAKAWNSYFCLKAAYFQKGQGQQAYRARPTLAQLGVLLVDSEALGRLMPNNSSADEKTEASGRSAFLRALTAERGDSLSDSTVSSRLKRATQAFAQWLERREAQGFAYG